jgi:carbamoyltransferase
MILGLHFGHDSAVSAIGSDGKILANFVSERHSGVRHAFGLKLSLIMELLEYTETTLDDIEAVAITSTQNYELIIENDLDSSDISLSYGFTELHPKRPITVDLKIEKNENAFVKDVITKSLTSKNPYYTKISQFKSIQDDRIFIFPYLTNYAEPEGLWNRDLGLEQLGMTDWSSWFSREEAKELLYFPCVFGFLGKLIPAYVIHHHICHLSYSFFTQDSECAVLASHDGGFFNGGPNNGLIAFGISNEIIPITPHHIQMGEFYDRVGTLLGFDLFGAAGKLMGLAAYGKPRCFRSKFVGNVFDNKSNKHRDALYKDFLSNIKRINPEEFQNLSLPDCESRFSKDIASSAQKILEDTMLQLAITCADIAIQLKMPTDTLALSGGVALNCPSNTKLYNSGLFNDIKIPPAVDDSGLAVGAALYLYHHVLGNPRVEKCEIAIDRSVAYLGRDFTQEKVAEILSQYDLAVIPDENLQLLVNVLASGGIAGWFLGRSEHGPRALCGRSILADPRNASNWDLVNSIKQRERWRPFAPVVLQDDVHLFFSGCPTSSPYMLFNANVLSTRLPAVTHVDNTARIQTINSKSGKIYELLCQFKNLTGVGVLMNTSFNGPGQPIVDSPTTAIKFFLESELNSLWIEGLFVSKNGKKVT